MHESWIIYILPENVDYKSPCFLTFLKMFHHDIVTRLTSSMTDEENVVDFLRVFSKCRTECVQGKMAIPYDY